jgi:hypothetical protein
MTSPSSNAGGQSPVFVAVYTNLENPDGVFNDGFVADAAAVALSALG